MRSLGQITGDMLRAVSLESPLTSDGDRLLRAFLVKEEAMSTKSAPFYISHKRVQALEIKSVNYAAHSDGTRDVTFVTGETMALPPEMFGRYSPIGGDFLVIYEDGYQSFSPRKVFLDGYKPEGQSFRDIKQSIEEKKREKTDPDQSAG